MHDQSIIDTILKKTDVANCSVKVVSLLAREDTLTKRIIHDINSGIRTIDVLERSIARIPCYQKLNSVKISTDDKSIREIAEEIKRI